MFCPNCGTKNTETATTCTKCGFNIKGAAAPKFKGTMLMMNPSAAKPAAPADAAPPAAAPGPPAAPGAGVAAAPPPSPAMPRPNFKGTMVGVAPPGGVGVVVSQGGAPPGPAAGYGPTLPAPAKPGAPPAAVNPLGGTVAVDQMGQGFAAAPAGSPGALAQGHGAPPAGYGPPPAAGYGYGAPPPQGGYQPPPAGYGAPPGAPGGYGAPQYGGQTDFRPEGSGPMVQASGALAPGAYGRPAIAGNGPIRNPLMVTVLSVITCGIYGIVVIYSMMSELRAYLQKQEIVPWQILVPVLNFVIVLGKLPEWVTEAKRRAGSHNQESAGPILYLLLLPYFFTKDMNEVWDPTGASS